MFDYEDNEDILTGEMSGPEQVKALNELGKTVAEIKAAVDVAKGRGEKLEQLDIAVANLTEAVRGVKEANVGAHRAPTSSEAELKRYIGDETDENKLRLYGSEVAGFHMPGLLDTTVDHGDWHREFKRANEEAWLVAIVSEPRNSRQSLDYKAIQRRAPRCWKRLQFLAKRAPPDIKKRILDNTDGTGGEFIPVEVRLPMLDQEALLDSDNRITGLFEETPMTNETVVNPFIDTGATPYLAGVPSDDDPAKLTASTPTTDDRTRVSKTFAVRIVIASEASEDSILDNMAVMRAAATGGHANGVEDTIVNGDTGTHQDDLTLWRTRNLWPGTTGASNDHRRGWVGLRGRAFDVSNTVDGAGAFAYSDFLVDQASLDAPHGTSRDLVLSASPEAFIEYILGMTEVATVDKYGPNAAILTGEVARLGLARVTITDMMTNDLATTGLFTNTGATTGILLYNRSRFKMGRRRGSMVEIAKDIERQVDVIVVTQRLVFYSIDSSTKKNVRNRFNL